MPEANIAKVADESLPGLPVVVSRVRTHDGTPKFQRRVHLTLAAAQRAVQRAEARGCEATIRLCKLVPLEDEEA